MKVLSVEEARAQLSSFCDEALAGEVIRLQLANGALLELLPVPNVPPVSPLSAPSLAECYDDGDWAAFENRCGRASD